MDNLVVSFMFLINMVFQFFVSFVFWVCGMLDGCRIIQDYSYRHPFSAPGFIKIQNVVPSTSFLHNLYSFLTFQI